MAGVQSGELGVPDTGMQKKDYERPDWKLTESGATYRKGKFRSLNGDVYNGEWLNGKRHGKGQVKYANGDRYLGQFKEDRYSGFGVLTRADFKINGVPIIGRRYEGEFLDGKKHGQGVFVVGNGDVYDGGFRKDMYHGQGVLKYVNGDRYTGSWKNGLFHGQGKLRKANGDLYDGEFHSGYKHGYGELRYREDGGTYVGEWRRDKFHGKGLREFVNGTSYNGEYVNGEMHGKGKYSLPSGDYYLGEFEDNQFNGTGTFVFANGDRYVGTFLRGKFCGRGRFEYAGGGYYDGEYLAMKKGAMAGVKKFLAADGKREGRGVRVWVSGNRYEGEWKQDKMHGFGVFDGTIGGITQRYEGMFERGHRSGRGVCHYGNTDGQPFICPFGHRHDGRATCHYDGDWHFDCFHGQGRFVCADGRVYSGQFRSGKRHGKGMQVLMPDMHRGTASRMYMDGVDALYRAERYDGEWDNGVRHGDGSLVFENGDRIDGFFRSGNLHGPATITWKKGQRQRRAFFEFGMRKRWISSREIAADRKMAELLRDMPSPGSSSEDDGSHDGSVSSASGSVRRSGL